MTPAGERPDRLAILREMIADALANLYAVRQRSLLALVGIAIGSASVIAMLNIGHNAQIEALQQFKEMGTDILVIQKGFGGSEAVIRMEDVLAIPARVPAVEAVAPIAFANSPVGGGRLDMGISVVGATAGLAGIAKMRLREGRFVSDFDGSRTFAVVGARLAQELRHDGRALAVGDALQLGDYIFTVVGVLDGMLPNALLPVDFNGAVLIPLAATRRVADDPQITNIIARMRPGADDIATSAAVAADFRSRLRGGEVAVQSARQLIAGMERQMAVYTLLLAGIGGIALVVGGVGVMNVMLMGVMERRREIGIRLALGAKRSDIRTMFLVEALSLSFVGGAAGTVLGVVAAVAFAAYSGWRFELAAGALPLGTGAAAAMGLFFGIYPAVSAARLDPVAALRAD